MIQADVLFIKNDNFYNQINYNGDQTTGYELFFQLIDEFKNKYNYSIHIFGESNTEKYIYINFKSDYIIRLKECGNGRYIELYSHTNSIEDFTEKFNYIKNIISNMKIK